MSPTPSPECALGAPSPADRLVRCGAWLAVLSMVLALLWVGFALFSPAAAAAAPRPEQSWESPLSTAVADLPSARSTP